MNSLSVVEVGVPTIDSMITLSQYPGAQRGKL